MLIPGDGVHQAPWSAKDSLMFVELLALEVEHVTIPGSGPERRVGGVRGQGR